MKYIDRFSGTVVAPARLQREVAMPWIETCSVLGMGVPHRFTRVHFVVLHPRVATASELGRNTYRIQSTVKHWNHQLKDLCRQNRNGSRAT